MRWGGKYFQDKEDKFIICTERELRDTMCDRGWWKALFVFVSLALKKSFMSESLLDSNIDQLLANIGMRNVKSGTEVKEEEGIKKAGF